MSRGSTQEFGAYLIDGAICTRRFQGFNLQAIASVLPLILAVMVGLAGHYGAKLVHIYAVGRRGQFFERNILAYKPPFPVKGSGEILREKSSTL